MNKQKIGYGIGTLTLLAVLITSFYLTRRNHTNDALFTTNNERKTSYIYAPGLFGAEFLMARYSPKFTASTGEVITCTKGGHVIGEPHSTVQFPEINLKKPVGFTFNPLTAWFNGARRDLFPLAARGFQDAFGLTVQDNPNSNFSVFNYSFNFGQTNIGQKKDIAALEKTYTEHIKKYPETDIVLYGDSRGAATVFNFIALHQPKAVKAAVIEGIFDTIPHLLKHFIYSDKNPETEARLYQMLSFLAGSYNKNGICPRECAEKITANIPLLFVTSLKDELVATQCTMHLYKRLKERDFNNIHLLVLPNSWHPLYMLTNMQDKETYETVVHAFYKKYGLPHDSARAFAGNSAFAATQPTVAQLAQYQLTTCELC